MTIRIAALLLVSCAGGLVAAEPPPSVLEAESARIANVEAISPSVVCIFGRDGGGGGSGVLISRDGFALTNFHVTSGSGDFMKCGLNDGKLYDAVIVGIDPTGDVALIKLLGRDDFPAATLGDSDSLIVGEWVYVVGNPFLLAADFTPTVTYGIVSGLHRYQYPAGTFLEYTDCIQFDTSLNPGNSGGPLFNERGEVVGINGRGSFEKRGRVNVGAGYAISINQIKHFLDHLRSGRVVDHGSIGATVLTRQDGTVAIGSILETSDAYRRGLRSGDEIVTFAGRPIRSANQFQNVLGVYPSGWMLPLTYRRGAETHDIMVRLSNAHRESELLEFSKTPPDRENPQPGRKPESDEDPKEEQPTPPDEEAAATKEDDVPSELKQLLVQKPGFANYRFNEIEQARVLESLPNGGTLPSLAAGAVLSGRTEDGKPFRMTLADRGVGFDLGGVGYLQPLGPAEEFIDEPPGTGGLLAAAHLLRQILAGSRERLAAFYYLGSEPIDGIGPQVDVLIAEDQGGRLRLYVVREGGELLGFDFSRGDNVDDCRVRFGKPVISGIPAEWRVSYGGEEILDARVERIEPLRPSRDSR
ncbi:MAG: trypsin-like peptidase domain-containing protein [Planctomycetaceae bacterium]|nr:trypsin-like peptidase domain-containing protein [Planctomycetaceae bacterium]